MRTVFNLTLSPRWSVLAIGLAAAAALAGDLNPPAGPVAPTHKTLTEVEPRTIVNATNTPGDADSTFRISQPGSYYLIGDVTGEVGKVGIEIDANEVTLDLMGFAVRGVPGSLDGIRSTNGRESLSIVNGVVTGWGEDGIDLTSGFESVGFQVEGVRATLNAARGIRVGYSGAVRRCHAAQNGGHGISAASNGLVESCTVFSGDGAGIDVESICTVSGCSVFSGDPAYQALEGAVFTDCVALGGSSGGFVTGIGSLIRGCVATNGQSGPGFAPGDFSSVIDCTARLNSIGILTAQGCLVERCEASFNLTNGIQVTSACVIRDNTCDANGVAFGDGIQVDGFDNRIEGNSCTNNNRGLDVNAAGNIIIRNTCSGNTTANWDIVIGNAVAPIVAATTNGVAINGNTYAGSLGSTDPNANFTY